jgi:hypothetical protein
MNERDGLDRLITGVMQCGYDDDKPNGCPDEADIAAFVDGALDGDEADCVRLHTEGCVECACKVESALSGMVMPLDKPFSRTVDAALEDVRRHTEGVFGIAVRLIRDSIRMIGDAAGSGLEPAPALIRGRTASSNLVSTSRIIRGLKVELDIENVGGGMAEVVVGARRSDDGKPAQGLRASMFSDGRELSSMIMSGGSAAFEEVAPGRYTINLSSNGLSLSDIELDIRKEPEDGE